MSMLLGMDGCTSGCTLRFRYAFLLYFFPICIFLCYQSGRGTGGLWGVCIMRLFLHQLMSKTGLIVLHPFINNSREQCTPRTKARSPLYERVQRYSLNR